MFMFITSTTTIIIWMYNTFSKALTLLTFLCFISCSKEEKPQENRPPENFIIESIQYNNQEFSINWNTPNDPDKDPITYDVYIDDEKELSETAKNTFTGTLPYNSSHSGRIIATDKKGGNSEVTFTLEMPQSKILFFNAGDTLYALDLRTQKILWKDHMISYMNDLHSTLGDQIFVPNGKLQSRNILNGEIEWATEVNDPFESHFVMSDGEAIYGKLTSSFCERLNPADGSTEWIINTFESKGPAGLDDQSIYLTDRSNPSLRACDKITGKEKWTFSIPYEFGGEDYYNQIGHPPVTSNDKVFFRSGFGYFFALSKETGEMFWHRRLTTETISYYQANETRPVLYKNSILVIANSNVYSVNQQTGDLMWQINTGSHIYSSPFLYKDHIYFTSNEYLFCMDATSGAIKWRQNLPSFLQISPIVYDGLIYVGGDNYYFAFSVEDGSEAWRFPTGVHALTSPTLVIGESEKIIYPTINSSTN